MTNQQRSVLIAIAFFSGIPALIAQIVWTRQVALEAGSESEALALVVATFFAGLALGNHLLGPRIDRSRSDALRIYAGLEGGIGLLLMAVASGGLTGVAAETTEAIGLGRRFGATLVLLPATFLMGGAMPALLRAARGEVSSARDAGLLLAANTAGSVIGALISIGTIPSIGLTASLLGAGAISVVTAVGAGLTSNRASSHPAVLNPVPENSAATPESTVQCAPPSPPQRRARLGFILACTTGFVTLGAEVSTARLAALSLGSSLFAWGLVLATTLFGLAIGNHLGGRIAEESQAPDRELASLLAVAALGFVAIDPLIGHHPAEVARGLNPISLLRTIAAVLPAMTAMGAAFPFLVRINVREDHRAGDLGRLTAINTLGGVAGSLATAFIVLPALGPDRSALPFAGTAALTSLWLLSQPDTEGHRRRALTILGLTALVVATTETRPPSTSLVERVLSIDSGRRATTVVLATPRSRELIVDGDPEASTYGRAQRTERLLAAIPFAYHPKPERFLELGLGAGITLATAGRFAPKSLDCIEIAPSVVRAQPFFAPANAARPDSPDTQPNIHLGDARTFLRESTLRYDIIAANTAQPWSIHASSLYAREHYERIRAALSSGGLASQWLPTEGVDAQSLKLIFRTFFDVFEYGGLWWGDGSVFLLGSASPLAEFAPDRARERWRSAGLTPASLGLANIDALDLRQVASAATLRDELADEPVLTEDRPQLEGHWQQRTTIDAAQSRTTLFASLARAQSEITPKTAAVTMALESLELRAQGESVRADRTDGLLRTTGLAIGEAAIRERGLVTIEAALRAKDIMLARIELAELKQSLGNDGRLDFALGLIEESAGNPTAALDAYHQAEEQLSDDPSIPIRIARLHEPYRAQEARDAYRRALALDPYAPEALAGDGRTAIRLGKLEEAQDRLRVLRELSPLGPRLETRDLEARLAHARNTR